MNYADGIGLEQFLNDRWWRKNDTTDWDKFKLENEKGIENRVRLCTNIAVAINIIHKNRNYTIADIKPANFKIRKNGLVSIIDIDNIEVIENGKILYTAQVITPEYCPPEFHNGLDYKKSSASQNWDRYSLSILFYHILCGIHPFQFVKQKKSDEEYTDTRMIAEGLFLFGNKSQYLEPAHPQHKGFLNLSNEIKSLFIQCFDNGHDKPQLRPSAEDWCRVFTYRTSVIKRPMIAELINRDSNYAAKFKNALQFNVYSSPLVLKTNNEIYHSEVKFNTLSNSFTLLDKFINIFTKSKKQILVDGLKETETGITGFIKNQSHIKNDISNIMSEFESKQHEIKSNEKIQIDKLKKSLQLVLNDAEYLATKAQGEESKEILELQNQISSLIQKEEIVLANHHSSIYVDLIKNFEKKRSEYNANIHNCDVDKKNEIERLVNSPNKLAHYNLEKECVKIFHGNLPSVINALKQLNFITAADFSRVYSDGYLLNIYNKTIKIPGMGSERANKLHYWRIRIEETENDIIIRNTTDKYNKLKNEVSMKWNNTESNYNQTIAPLNAIFKSKEAEIKRNKDRLIETKEADLNRIKQKFDKFHIDLKNEFIKALNKFYLDIENIYRQTKTALSNNLAMYEMLIKSKESEVQESNHWIDAELKKYNLLYSGLSVR